MATVDKVKILVVGDSGVGKSSVVHLICHSKPLANPSWTIGATVEVKLHDYKAGTPFQKTYFAELWDIGGSTSHSSSRTVFYNGFNGIILVYDLTNRKSQQNLRKWLGEILSRDQTGKKTVGFEFDPEQYVDSQIPILVVGTKLDLAQQVLSPGRTNRLSSVADECGADEIILDCRQGKSVAPGSTNAVKISRFLDKVIERRFHNQSSSHIASVTDRRRLGPSSFKFSHID